MLAAPLLAGHGTTLPASDLDFSALIPARWPRSAVFTDPDSHLWDPAMVRTADGVCHLLYSTWPKRLGFDAWATHAEIAWATADEPQGPYRFHRKVLAARGGHWDGHSVYNTCLLNYGGKFYLYYTGNHGPKEWTKDRAPDMRDEAWWTQRNSQRIGVAVADHPGGPWTRFDKPLIDVGPDTGQGIIAVPNVIARPGGGFLMVYKTLAAGPGRFGGGVVHYPAVADNPLGPFRRHPRILIDKQKLLGTTTKFNFHIDDHVEWFQDDRYYGIVKDHDAPFISPHGRSLLLIESADGLDWRLSRHSFVKDFAVTWDDGRVQRFERLEMPKLYRESSRNKVLFLAARAEGAPSAVSFLLAVRLHEVLQGQ
jgi:hypothetical protein